MIAFAKQCPDCRKPFSIELAEPVVAFVRKQAEGITLLCEDCADRAAIAADREDAQRIADEMIAMRSVRLAEANPPPLPADFAWPNTRAGALAAAWVERKFPTLTIWGGDVGVGKSTLMNAAVRRRIEPRVIAGKVQAPRAAWRSMPSYLASLGSQFGSKAKADAIELTEGGIVLALDDLDKVRPSEYAAEAVFSLVDGCVSRKRSLIVTTNLSPVELGEKWPQPFGKAIASRLGGGTVIEMRGNDLRLIKGHR